MSSDLFPERIDPRKLFTRNGTISGEIPLSRLQRLSEYLSSNEAKIDASISFDRDASNRRIVNGTVQAKVYMLCQRCLKETQISLQSTLSVVVLHGKQWNDEVLNSLPDEVEAIKSTEDELDVQALIEDELILSLPAVAYHQEQDCNKELTKLKTEVVDLEQQDGSNAFASLLALKNELKDKDKDK